MDEVRISDELAIRELVASYADAVVRRDADAWSATWAEDGEWHILGNATRGRDAVVSLWKQLMAAVPFVVQVPGHALIEVDGARATGRWYITEYGKSADGSGSLTLGVYHDEYTRSAEGWRFLRRRFDALYSGPPDLSGTPQPFPEKV